MEIPTNTDQKVREKQLRDVKLGAKFFGTLFVLGLAGFTFAFVDEFRGRHQIPADVLQYSGMFFISMLFVLLIIQKRYPKN